MLFLGQLLIEEEKVIVTFPVPVSNGLICTERKLT